MNTPTSDVISFHIEAANPRPPLQLIKETVSIDEPILTEGADVFIACSTLTFTGIGSINTGYSQPAAAGANGLSAGNITIIARSVQALHLTTQGQTGGRGAMGYTGSRGARGSDGTAGSDAYCQGRFKPKTAGRGGDGEKGGVGGPGGTGGTGGRGGDSGNVRIRYVDSAVELTTVPPDVDLSGGLGGSGGVGGSGGPGGPGGSGGPGGMGITCTIPSKQIDGMDSEETADPGPDGEPGETGDRGPDGTTGLPGSRGNPGQWLPERFASDEAFHDVIVGYLPSLAGGQLRKAELLMLLNRRNEAQSLLREIAGGADKRSPAFIRTQLLLDRLDPVAPRNYFNKPIFWAPILLKEAANKEYVLKTTSDFRSDLDDIRILLKEASEIANYRAEKVYRAEQAIRAYEFENRQIKDRLQDIKNRINRAPAELDALVDRLRSLEAQALMLKGRVERLVQFLADLPAEIVQKGRDFLSSISSLAINVGAAIVAAKSQQWSLAGSLILNGIADLQRGLDSAQGLLNLRVELEGQIDLARQELARVGSQINQANYEIHQLLTRQAEDGILQDSLLQTQDLLTTFQLNQDAASLRQLLNQSEEALWHVRMSVAEQIYSIRRYLDLRMGRDDAIQPMRPPGGIYDAFSYGHLLAMLTDIQRTVLQSPTLSAVDWGRAFSGDGFIGDLKRLSDKQKTNFAITGAPKFLERARVRSVSALIRDFEGQPVRGYFELSHTGGRHSFSDAVLFDFEPKSWIFQIKEGVPPKTDERFAFRNLSSNWTLQVLSVDDPAKKVASVEWVFGLEVPPSAAAPDEINTLEVAGDDRPVRNRRGSAEWLEAQQVRLAALVKIHTAAIARSTIMVETYGAMGADRV